MTVSFAERRGIFCIDYQDETTRRPYTIAGNQLFLTSERSARDIEEKARKIIGLIKRGVRFMPTQPVL
ncbi:MAG: hypothetical protein R3Y67_01245 [Eubacteriales bacterium]